MSLSRPARKQASPCYVLPPKKPEYNGCVERANGTSRYEFYPFYEGPLNQSKTGGVSDPLQSRPHDGIGLLTPMSTISNSHTPPVSLIWAEPGHVIDSLVPMG